MNETVRKSTPPPTRVALVFYLTKNEREIFDKLREGTPFGHPDSLKNGARRVMKALLEANLLEAVDGIEEGMTLYKLKPIVGMLVRDIAERHNYRVPADRYDFIQHVQQHFRPDTSVKLLRDSKAQLVQFLEDWKASTGRGADLEINAWIMSGKLSTSPAQGSGIVTFEEGDKIYYVTIPGLEAFDLECVEKDVTRSARRQRNSVHNDDEMTRPMRERLEAERKEITLLRDTKARLELELEQIEATIADREARIHRIVEALKLLSGGS